MMLETQGTFLISDIFIIGTRKNAEKQKKRKIICNLTTQRILLKITVSVFSSDSKYITLLPCMYVRFMCI